MLGLVLTLAPWTLRNARVLGEINDSGRFPRPLPTFVPVTIYGPINLALANNPMAEGGFSRDYLTSQAHMPGLDLTDPQHLEFFLDGDSMAWRYIRENPVDWLRLVLKKWAIFFDALSLGFTQWNWPAGLDGIRNPRRHVRPLLFVGAPDHDSPLARGTDHGHGEAGPRAPLRVPGAAGDGLLGGHHRPLLRVRAPGGVDAPLLVRADGRPTRRGVEEALPPSSLDRRRRWRFWLY